MRSDYPTNQEIADVIERVAALLEAQDANPYRVGAYRKAARLVERTDRSIAQLAFAVEGEKLEDLPDIGNSIEGKLRTIAPRRFNPEGTYRLPVLHTDRGGWHFNALFSNTARAHELGKTRDWVVIYYEKDGRENQHTVVTETHGPLKGRRAVRGREKECLDRYGQRETKLGSGVGSPEEFVTS